MENYQTLIGRCGSVLAALQSSPSERILNPIQQVFAIFNSDSWILDSTAEIRFKIPRPRSASRILRVALEAREDEKKVNYP
jgi:hypothetical protein